MECVTFPSAALVHLLDSVVNQQYLCPLYSIKQVSYFIVLHTVLQQLKINVQIYFESCYANIFRQLFIYSNKTYKLINNRTLKLN